MNTNKGFSLIELMVVIAIVAILAAVALPSYKNYKVRAQVAKGIALADVTKNEVLDYYNKNGSFPAGQTFIHDNPDPEVNRIFWNNDWDAIEIWYYINNDYSYQKIVMLYPTVSNNTVNWLCASHHLPLLQMKCGYLPASCQGDSAYGGCAP